MPPVVQQDIGHRPKLVTVARQGDPVTAVALVMSQPGNLDDSIQFAALLSRRLSGSSTPITVLPRIGGVSVVGVVATPQLAISLVNRVDSAVRKRVDQAEVDSTDFELARRDLRRLASLQGTTTQKLCEDVPIASGGLAVSIERHRVNAFAEQHARWSAVGAQPILTAVKGAVQALEPWPNRTSIGKAWPARDHATVNKTDSQSARVDIVWRATSAARAIYSLRNLTTPSGNLDETLRALPIPMRIERSRVTPLELGACASISLTVDSPNSSDLNFDGLATSARIASEFLRQKWTDAAPQGFGNLAIVEQEDPRLAAELAGTLALSADAEHESERLHIEVYLGAGPATSKTPSEYQAALSHHLRRGLSPESMPLVQLVELGQGATYALLASPCATISETGKSVGATSLLLRAIAQRLDRSQDVDVAPWISGSGVGLIAAARRRSPHERPDEQASRLGSAIGRLLVASRLESADLWQSRNELLVRLGPGPRPALWQAVMSISPQYPALIAPDGTFATVESISLDELRERRAALLRVPLRLAVLANAESSQGVTVRRALARWLAPFREFQGECPAIPDDSTVAAQDIRVESTVPDLGDAPVTLSKRLPSTEPGDEAHAALLLWLLQRGNGWFAKRLRDAKVVATVDARIVGGEHRRGLVVAIGAPAAAGEPATLAVRSLFDQLAESKPPDSTEVLEGLEHLRQSDEQRRRSPRARLVDLWLSRKASVVSESTFRSYLKRAFATPGMTVVRSLQMPFGSEPPPRPKR